MSEKRNDGLKQLISSYDNSESESSDEDEEESQTQITTESNKIPSDRKRNIVILDDKDDEKFSKARKKDTDVTQGKSSGLPLPKGILDMFNEKDNPNPERDAEHQGRIRSFEHFPGNWAMHVYIPFFGSAELETVISSLVSSLPSAVVPKMHLFPCKELHLSVSRTVPIRHYWIDPIVENLRVAFANKQRFYCIFERPKVYTNDEKTRSFIGLQVLTGTKQLRSLVSIVDGVFEEFSLPKFYEIPSFHVSVAWFLGEIHDHLTEADEQKLMDMYDSLVSQLTTTSATAFEVSEIRCKIGNKLFSFALKAR